MKKTFPPAPRTTAAGHTLEEAYNPTTVQWLNEKLDEHQQEQEPEDWQDDFWMFSQHCKVRLEAGAEEYGNQSFRASDANLHRELAEELLDVATWAFIRWRRLELLKERLETQGDLVSP